MSKEFTTCRRSPNPQKDVTRSVSRQSQVESRSVFPKSPAAAKPKARGRLLSLRRLAIVNDRKSNLTVQRARENDKSRQNIFRGFNPKSPITLEAPHMDPDPFVGIPEVFGISERVADKRGLFDSFLEAKEAAMVLFYNPDGRSSKDAKRRFKEAARTTQRDNHAYLAIDCIQLPGICSSQKIRALPAFKLYSYGKFVGHYDNELTTAADLKLYTETSPVTQLPLRQTETPCAIL